MEDGGIYEFYLPLSGARALNMWGTRAQNNVNVNLYTADHTPTQRWIARLYDAKGGGWRLHCAADERFVLDRWRGRTHTHNADIYTAGSTKALLADQLLHITPCGQAGEDGLYRISLAGDGRCLCAVSDACGSGTGRGEASAGNVRFAPPGAAEQVWRAVKVGRESLLVEGVRPPDMCYDSDAYTGAQNTFPAGQCTWHAWGRTKEVTGIGLAFDIPHGKHGCMWYDHVTNARARSRQAPAVGGHAVMCWRNGTYGHVAFVEKYDGSHIWLTEANYNGDGVVGAQDGVVIRCTLAAAKAHVRSGFQGFLLL